MRNKSKKWETKIINEKQDNKWETRVEKWETRVKNEKQI